jgi:hypothetical protein
MLKTYKAMINNEHLEWLEEQPGIPGRSILAYVTILDNPPPCEEENKNSLIEFFQNSPLYGLSIDLERDKDPGREVEF